jgi:hypothetical protein
MRLFIRTSVVGLVLGVVLAVTSATAAPAQRAAGAIWAHDILYDTVLTDTSFMAPPAGSTDVIYNFMMSGLDGQHSVAETAPGDRDYNGGRWSVQAVVFTDEGLAAFDTNNDGHVDEGEELTNAEDVLDAEADGYLEITDIGFYFECPLQPRRGRSVR